MGAGYSRLPCAHVVDANHADPRWAVSVLATLAAHLGSNILGAALELFIASAKPSTGLANHLSFGSCSHQDKSHKKNFKTEHIVVGFSSFYPILAKQLMDLSNKCV